MKKRNLFKLAALTAVFALAGMFASAQITSPDGTDILVQSSGAPGATGGTIKVIDNKGTVKYIQASNGITSFTNTATPGGVVTTFQLGGQLIDSTYIDVNGNKFGIKGLTTAGTGAGLQLVVIDGNGALQKLNFTDLIQSGHEIYTIGTPAAAGSPGHFANTGDTYTFTVYGTITLPTFKNVYVYRNGAKLLAGVDYTIGLTPYDTFIITANATTDGFPLYAGDKIEIHFIK